MSKSPAKKKPKRGATKALTSDDEDMAEKSLYGDIVEVVHSSVGWENWEFLYDVGDDLKITDIKCNIEDMYIGDQILKYNGVDMRGKTWFDLNRLACGVDKSEKVTLLLLRVNGNKYYLHPGVKVISILKNYYWITNLICFLPFSATQTLT